MEGGYLLPQIIQQIPTLFQCGLACTTYFGSFIQCPTKVMYFLNMS